MGRVFIVHILSVKLVLKWQVTEARQLSLALSVAHALDGGGAARCRRAGKVALADRAACGGVGVCAGCGAYSNAARWCCDSQGPGLHMVIQGGGRVCECGGAKGGEWSRRGGLRHGSQGSPAGTEHRHRRQRRQRHFPPFSGGTQRATGPGVSSSANSSSGGS